MIKSDSSPKKIELTKVTTIDSPFQKSYLLLNLSLIWSDFEFKITSKNKVILPKQYGVIKGGKLTAILGKSGSGKTSLIESLSGRKYTGVTGQRYIAFSGTKPPKSFNISYVPQYDHLHDQLTVRESLNYASRLKNRRKSFKKASTINDWIQKLDLDSCSDNFISKCSGGQRKRVSIGSELVGDTNILFLDELTSGLDSASAYQCIYLIRQMVDSNYKNGLTIIVSIHQPSAKILSLFHQILVLSHRGYPIYHGAPDEIIDTFSKYNLICPNYTNPGDFAIEVSSGEYGNDVLTNLTEDYTASCILQIRAISMTRPKKIGISKLGDKPQNLKQFLYDLWILLQRKTTCLYRNKLSIYMTIIVYLMLSCMTGLLFGNEAAKETGCFDASTLGLLNRMESKPIRLIHTNIAFGFSFLWMITFGTACISALTVSRDISTLIKEYDNNWYSISCYYCTTLISSFPIQIITSAICSVVSYISTGQAIYSFRFLAFYGIMVICSLEMEGLALIIGTIFNYNTSLALFVTIMSIFPLTSTSGFLIKVKYMNWFFQKLSLLNYQHHAINVLGIIIYGHNRCKKVDDYVNIYGEMLQMFTGLYYSNAFTNSTITEKRSNEVMDQFLAFFERLEKETPKNGESFGLKFLDVNEDDLLPSLFFLFASIIFSRIIWFIVLQIKIRYNK